ncbi:MAG TPA: thiamine pyrophosphate-binding protein [Gammaproteobacteria bacterium]|nr:thiamine pyrophosphate-binding protein [Gammaproteobacteria bacterium]
MQAIEYLIKRFITEDVKHLFMVPGGHVDPMLVAFEACPEFQAIVAGHESGATYMADGYAKVSGKFGIAAGIGGPGLTNMMTGITTAYSDHTPIFVITGEPPTYMEGRGAFQDTSDGSYNSNIFLTPVTNKHLAVTELAQLEPQIDSLFHNMLGTNPGPVQLDFPKDLQPKDVDITTLRKLPDSLYHPRILDQNTCDKTWDFLRGASKIAILAGMGSLFSEATDELIRFAETYEIPVATTLGGKGVFPENHRLSLGVLGWFGNPYAMETLHGDEIEVLIVLGSRLNQTSTVKWSPTLKPKKALVLNDIEANAYYANYQPDHFVLGDSQTFLRALNTAQQQQILLETVTERKKWLEQIRKSGPNFYNIEHFSSDLIPIHPARVIKELRQVMPENTILFSGEGASGFIASHYWTTYGPRQHFSQVKYMSPMGWSIAAAIGGKVAKPNVPVVAIIGDGSMLMHGLEIQTAARYGLAVIFIVFNNGAHGNPQLRARQVGQFQADFLKLPVHDWAKIAEGLGVIGISVTKPEQLNAAFTQALALNKAVLIDVQTGNYDNAEQRSPF